MFGQRTTTGIDAAAFEYDARYQPQSTEDRENVSRHLQKKPNYRPTPLRWYFIVVVIALLILVMGLVVWARQAMPNSDNTYKLEDKRWMAYKEGVVAIQTAPAAPPTELSDYELSQSAAEELRRAAEDFAIFDRQVATDEVTQQQQAQGIVRTSYIVSKITETITESAAVSTYTSSSPTQVYYSTYTEPFSYESREATVSSAVESTTYTTMTEMPTVISQPPIIKTSVVTFTETSFSMIPGTFSGNISGTVPPPMQSVPYETERTETMELTLPGSAFSTVMEVETEVTDYTTRFLTLGGVTKTYGGEEATSAYSTGYKVVTGEVTQTPKVYVRVGEVTITSVYTEPGDSSEMNPNKNNEGDKDKDKEKGKDKETPQENPKDQEKPKDGDKDNNKDNNKDKPKEGENENNKDKPKDGEKENNKNPPQEQKPTPKVIDVVSVKQDETVQEVKQLGPVTVVKSVEDVEQVVKTQAPVTIVRPVDAVETTVNVVTTNAAGVAVTKQVVSTIQGGAIETTVAVVTTGPDGVVKTEQVVKTLQPGAVETTVAVVTTGADGLPTTQQVVKTLQPGAVETTVAVVTTGADGLPTTQQVVKTLQPGSFETTVQVVTTGADGLPTTQQVVKTIQPGSFETTIAVVTTGADGRETTLNVVSTVQPDEFVTTVDVVTTGTDGLPTTSKLVTTLRGKLTTIVSTPGLTTFTTTKSARLSTITSTPSGSTTITSTKKGTTVTDSTTIMETPEPTGEPSEPKVHTVTKVIKSTTGSYFLGKFVPVILAVLLSIPMRIIDLNAQLYQPFYALNQANGAAGKSSMTLHFSGFKGFIRPFSLLGEGQPVPFITTLIVLCSALMTALSTEAIGLKLHGTCSSKSAAGCAVALGVSPNPTHALLGLIAFTIVLLCALLYFLRNWDTGLYANPWSIVGMASLATNQQIRPRKLSEKKIEREMADKRYGFGYFQNAHGETEYGIVLYDDAGQTLHQEGNATSETSSIEIAPQKKKRANPFMALGWAWRLSFIAFLLGLIVLVFYYHLSPDTSTSGLQKFFDGRTFGVRFFFSAMGVILSFGWTALFISVAMIGPYQRMSNDPQLPADSILMTRPTNGFTGLWASVRHKQIYPGIVAVMTILSEFMPILLTNVPYGLTQTKNTHQIASRLSLAIMILMLLTMIGSFFVKWPHMPVDPRSIGGAMYYVTESNMLNHFHGLASLDKKERERRIKELGGRYWFGQIVSKHGETRTVVDRDDGTLGIENYVASRQQQQQQQQHGYDEFQQFEHQQQQQSPQMQQQPASFQAYQPVSPSVYSPVSPYETVDTAYHGHGPGHNQIP